MYPERLELNDRPHFSSEEIFPTPLVCVRGFTEKNYGILMHSQEFYEINIILSGTGMHYICGGRVEASVGDVYIIPPNFLHGYVGGDGFDVYHLLLNHSFFEKYGSDLMLLPSYNALFKVEPAMRQSLSSKLHLRLEANKLAEILPLLLNITVLSHRPEHAKRIICQGEALKLIAVLCEEFDCVLDKNERTEPGGDEAFMKSIAYIYENYAEKLLIDDLVTLAKMSRTAYLAKFKKFTGTTPGEFLTSHRVSVAAQLLCETPMSVSQIAALTGFYDAPHLIRTFTRHMGVSPICFRERKKS